MYIYKLKIQYKLFQNPERGSLIIKEGQTDGQTNNLVPAIGLNK